MLKDNPTKTEYMECNFGQNMNTNKEVKIDNQEVPRSDHFCYICSIIHKEGDIVEDFLIELRWGVQSDEDIMSKQGGTCQVYQRRKKNTLFLWLE